MKEPCRFIVLDTPRARVAKIASILLQQQHDESKCHDHADADDDSLDGADDDSLDGAAMPLLEFLPCVATFDAYQDEQTGKRIRYLASVDYYGPDVSLKKSQSLLPFFDEQAVQHDDAKNNNDDDKKKMKNKNRCGGICGVAVGMGVLGDEEDLARIKAFLTTLLPTRSIPVESIQPCYPLYASIQDELDAFRDLDADAKVEATRLQVMGPGRMAKFVTTFASKVIEHALREEDGQDPKKTDWVEKDIEAVDGEEDKTATADSSLEGNPSDVIFAAPPRVMDPDKMRYSCRTCRTILFGHDDLEDPPHVASRHHFSRRKATHGLGGTAASSCESYFLQTSLPRMGSGEIDGGQNEGKFACSHCGTKLGTYNWSGAQCSCGTWVVPAIQIPKSRVDAIVPANQQQFTAPIITPLILQPAAATVVNAAGPGPAACD